MKLKNISVAIMVALGVVACGGSDNNEDNNRPAPVDPPPQPQPETKPEPQPEARNDDKTVDPTGTKVVDGRDLSKESTVGGLQYIRRDSSDYDRIFNPDKMASATPLLGVGMDTQNPKLTNIVLARRDLMREDNKAVRAQFAGAIENEPLTSDGKPRDVPSLQVENFKNVDILAGAFKQVGSADFGAADNRLGADHNIDTHIQNNVDKKGEFTRERVTHVYTPRFEYRQPFVDYPNAKVADNNKLENPNDAPPQGVETVEPPPPGFPDIDTLQKKLLDTDGAWAINNNNDNSRHPVNIGTGKDSSFGSFSNERKRYGNFPEDTTGQDNDNSPTDPSHIADAKAWRNKGTRDSAGTAVPDAMTIDPEGNRFYGEDAEVDTSQNNKKARENNVVNWEGSKNNPAAFAGTVSRAKSITRTGANSQTYTYAGRTYDYRQEWPNGAYPKYPKKMFAYPNVPYDEANNNALTGGTTAGGDPKDHEHIYLEREDFTAIRQLEPIRPLVNPVANEWDWTLYQKWAAVYQIHATYYSWEPVEWDNHGNVIRWDWVKTTEGYINPESYPFDGTDKMPIKNMGDMVGTKYFGQGCNDTSKRCVHEGYTPVLNYAEWILPANKGGGQRGEFRGPAYVGYHEDDSTIRYADNRIWQAGAPGHKQEYERKYGANLIWWSTQDSAFENHATSNGWDPRARRVDINTTKDKDGNPNGGEGSEDLVWAKQPDTLQADGNDARDRDIEIQPTGDITNGLIRIGGTDRTGGKLPTLGQEQKWAGNHWEDHHKTSTRIFGHYHLAYADQDERTVQDMGMNSYLGARSFVAKVKDKLDTPTAQGYWANLDSQPVEYSIGAEPITLKKVQYGRVTSQLDLSSGEGPFGDGFLRAPFAKKGTADSVDNYFFRGIDATSVADMPKEGSATYKGHALMYGINNDFHGITGDVSVKGGTKSLPNAFAGVQQRGNAEIGLGNFVEANVDFATRKVKGDVYNAWLVDVKKANVVHDKLVAFEGDITGNTVLGKADRTYIPGNDEADFRAAFFGKEADEMGGSFNSVKPDDKYGSAYEYGDWGGAFGAKKIGTNTFQGDDGANLYGNSNTQQNNYGP